MADESDGGDAVCWLDQLCPECRAMPTEDQDGNPPAVCWRCGAPLPPRPGPRATNVE